MVGKLKKSAVGITESSIIIGVGSSAIGAAGGDPAAIAPLGRALPPLGAVAGAGAVISGLGQLGADNGKRKKKNTDPFL